MHLKLNTSLKKEDRAMYTGRLLKLHAILADAPAENYKHSIFTEKNSLWKRWRTGCGTAACAIGHACLHADQFPGFKVQDLRAFPEIMRDRHINQPVVPMPGSFNYFGPKSYEMIFDTYAYGKPAESVTKYDALQRIEDYITKVLGCQLIEA